MEKDKTRPHISHIWPSVRRNKHHIYGQVFGEINITPMLEEVKTPTLVIHSIGDSIAPLAEGRLIASRIPGAQLITLNSNNHMVLEHEPDFERFLEALKDFMQTD